MILISILIIILFILAILFKHFIKDKLNNNINGNNENYTKSLFKYNKRYKVMTEYELSFFNFINEKLNNRFVIIPQANLTNFIYWEINGSKDKLAKSNIDRYSVDFLLCDKVNSEPKLVIELDDYTHNREYVIKRDEKKETIIKQAGIILCRFNYKDNMSNDEKLKKIETELTLIGVK